MREYTAEKIRNVVILGHLGSGKTSLTESLLFRTGALKVKGEVEKKNTVSDYLPEEQSRLTSLTASLIPVEWKDYKINFIDTPGSEEFIGEIENVLSVVKGAILVIDASKGVEVGTERCWLELRKRHIPTLIVVNKMDKENVKFENVLNDIIDTFGKKAVPFTWPLGHEDKFDGYVNVTKRRARIFNGIEVQDADIYPDKIDKINELYDQIEQVVASNDEELLEKYFGGETLTLEELRGGLRQGTLDGEIFPILVASSVKNVGTSTILDMVCDYLPAPCDLASVEGVVPATYETVTRNTNDNVSLSGYVFKTIFDPFLGTINFFKLYSGTLRSGQEVYVPEKDVVVKLPNIFTMLGKNQVSVDVLHAGDIGCVAKVDLFTNGTTFCDKKDPIVFAKVSHPSPVIYLAIEPKNRQDEDKISTSLQKLRLEDDTFEIKRNPETEQLLIGGQGLTQLGYILEKMRNMFKVEVATKDPKIVYRETIRATGSAQGRHKKQSGGAGQFGDVWIRFEPSEKDFEFDEEVFGGAVPKNYFPAVEKGLQETFEHGPLAGFPVIGVKAVLYDGSYHPVDSNEVSFKIAASLAFKEACKVIKPTILEPIMEVQVTIKDDYVGDVMGDMTKRRGRVLGIEADGGFQVITAEVPEAEIVKYAVDLKAMTQASGFFTRKFLRYEAVPEMLIPKIIAEYKK